MAHYIFVRVAQAVVTIVAVSMVVFLFMHLSGDPAALLVAEEATPEDIALMRERLGLDRPLHIQYVSFIRDFLFSDTLRSFRYYESLRPLILRSLRWTLVLAGGATVISVVLAVPLGTLTALKRGSLFDVIVRLFAILGQSMPSFWVAMLLILVVAVKLPILPVSGLGVKHAILPMLTLSFFQVAVLVRLIRSEMLEVLHQDYVRTARSKGLKETVVILRHALKNAMLPVVTMAGLQLSSLVLGAVVVEPIFAWPGLGHLMVNSVFGHDYPVVVGGTLVAGVLVTGVNLVVDILYGTIDPRISVR